MALLGVAPAAQAQGQGAPESYQVRPDSSDTRSYEVSFTDDPLDALPTSSYIAQIRVRSKHVRALLIRPRTSFVTEMLVSVQAL
jgi:hypothetical protein